MILIILLNTSLISLIRCFFLNLIRGSIIQYTATHWIHLSGFGLVLQNEPFSRSYRTVVCMSICDAV